MCTSLVFNKVAEFKEQGSVLDGKMSEADAEKSL